MFIVALTKGDNVLKLTTNVSLKCRHLVRLHYYTCTQLDHD